MIMMRIMVVMMRHYDNDEAHSDDHGVRGGDNDNDCSVGNSVCNNDDDEGGNGSHDGVSVGCDDALGHA